MTSQPDFKGRASQIKVWNRALSPQEIDDSRLGTLTTTNGLVAHYPLDGDLRDLAQGHDGTACRTVNFVPITGTTGPLPRLSITDAPNAGLTVAVNDPGNAHGPLLLWMCDYLQPTAIGTYQSQLPLLPSTSPFRLVTLSDPWALFGPPVSPTSELDGNGDWSLNFPTAVLHYLYGFAATDVHFEATVFDLSNIAAPDVVTILPVTTFWKPAFP